jgi:hypothetical protein
MTWINAAVLALKQAGLTSQPPPVSVPPQVQPTPPAPPPPAPPAVVEFNNRPLFIAGAVLSLVALLAMSGSKKA